MKALKSLLFTFVSCVAITACTSRHDDSIVLDDIPLDTEEIAQDETIFLQEEDIDTQQNLVKDHELVSLDANQSAREKSQHALSLINHVNWVVCKIVNTDSKVVLEEEYEGINADGLLLDCIEDQQTIDCIKDIMGHITDSRLNLMEREFLQEMYEQEKRALIYKAIPNPTAIISPDYISLAVNLASSAATGYMRYKQAEQALKRQFKENELKLDEDKIKYLNDLNVELLQKQYELVQKHHISDSNRVTVRMLKDLNEWIADRNSNYEIRTYELLKAYEDSFMYLPEYWYYRGLYAKMNGKKTEELEAYNQFQKIYYEFLRNDHLAAFVAMDKSKLLIEMESNSLSEIERQLEIIEKNAKNSDWELHYYCGVTYLHYLSKPREAYNCFRKAYLCLEREFQNKLTEYYNKMDAKEKDKDKEWLKWDTNLLMLCRTQLMLSALKSKTEDESFEVFSNILNNRTMSPFEFFPYFIDSNLVDSDFIHTIQSSAFCRIDTDWTKTDDFEVLIPMRFFYCGFEGVTVKFYSKEKLVDTIDYDKKALSYKLLKGKTTKNRFRCILYDKSYEFDNIERKEIDCIDVEFPNKYHTITIRYTSSTPGTPIRNISNTWISPTHILCDGKTIELKADYPTMTPEQSHAILNRVFR